MGGRSVRVRNRFKLVYVAASVAVAVGLLPHAAVAGGFAGPEGVSQRTYTWTTQADSVSASVQHRFVRQWDFSILNGSDNVTSPTVTVNSGYPASDFSGVSSFPVMNTQPSLLPGQSLGVDLPSSIVLQTTAGFDSTRSVTPNTVQPGGTQQTVTISIDLTDSRYALGGQIIIDVPMDVAGETGICGTTSAGTNPPFGANCSVKPDGTVEWVDCVSNCQGALQVNQLVQFTVLLNVPNASRHAVVHHAPAEVIAYSGGTGGGWNCTQVDPVTGFRVDAPSLDGPTPGSGWATFTINESVTWLNCSLDVYHVKYAASHRGQGDQGDQGDQGGQDDQGRPGSKS